MYCVNNQHDLKGWGENQRIMLHDKTSLLTLTPMLKNGPERLAMLYSIRSGDPQRKQTDESDADMVAVQIG